MKRLLPILALLALPALALAETKVGTYQTCSVFTKREMFLGFWPRRITTGIFCNAPREDGWSQLAFVIDRTGNIVCTSEELLNHEARLVRVITDECRLWQ